MNDIEQRQIKKFCSIFVFILMVVVVVAAFGSFSSNFQ
jgi:uncharacterized membrane protein